MSEEEDRIQRLADIIFDTFETENVSYGEAFGIMELVKMWMIIGYAERHSAKNQEKAKTEEENAGGANETSS